MTPRAIPWIYALPSDVRLEKSDGGAFLCTLTSRTWIEGDRELEMLDLLVTGGQSEAAIVARLQQGNCDDELATRCAALLFRIDRLGLLARELHAHGRRLASSVPLGPSTAGFADQPPDGLLQLSPRAFVRIDKGVVCVEAPGSAGKIVIHDRDLLPLLHDLATGRPASEIAASAGGHSEDVILAVLAMMSAYGLLGHQDDDRWSRHDLLFHARTRRGYARVLLGKSDGWESTAVQPEPAAPDGPRRIALEPPDLPRLLANDPPYALVSERRRSVRRQGSVPITLQQLSEWLFRTLHDRGGRRPYPSGGACYPLNAYLAVHRCRDVARGLYVYAAGLHELVAIGDPGPGFERVVADAAATANLEQPPQIVLVLAARFARTQRVYGALSYSLILKEVGAVFQAAMMAAAAMGLGSCPLGCGNSREFSELLGVDPLTETSVGEMIVGSLEENV